MKQTPVHRLFRLRLLTPLLAFFLAISSRWEPLAADSFEVGPILEKAGANAVQLQEAMDTVSADHREGLEFLLTYMPEHDLQSLTASFLIDNVEVAYQSWKESPWADEIPKEVFLNNILPYANINERRDDWRRSFYERFKPMIAGIRSPGLAAARLNQHLFPQLNVKYSTQRKKADQSPFESMESGLASCTGLSILLIDACRSVGIPARFVGTPLWSDKSGNHSWVEVYDQGWHFTGAAEPNGDALDQTWFIDRAAKADREHRLHAIYAVSYQHTPLPFPMVWKRGVDYVHAVNVTDRYTQLGKSLPEGFINLMVRVLDGASGNRCAAPILLKDAEGEVVFEGKSKDESFDANDHLVVAVPEGKTYTLSVPDDSGQPVTRTLTAQSDGQLIDLKLPGKQE